MLSFLPEIKLLLENDFVKVVEVHVRPGEKLEMHTHPAYVAYTISPTKIRFTFPDGTMRETQTEKGKALFSEGVTHAIENIGSSEMVSVDVEIKKKL